MTAKRQPLLMSALSVAVCMILLGYSAYGWFNMNRVVTAITESLTITAPSSLEISLDGTEWSASVTVDLKEVVRAQLSAEQLASYDAIGKIFYLMPASSLSGVSGSLWQTNKVTGAAPNGTVFAEGRAVAWNPSTSSFEGHYVDVPLWFRCISGDDVEVALEQTETTIRGLGANPGNIASVVRVAFLNEQKTAPSTGTAPLVLAGEGASMPGGVITGPITENDGVRTLTFDSSLNLAPDFLTYDADGLSETLFPLSGSDFAATPKKIIVRLWVEGQDNACVAAVGGKTFEVNLSFMIREE